MRNQKKLFNEIRQIKEFKRDFKKLLRTYKTLQDDLDIFIKTQLYLSHKLKIDNSGIVRIAGLGIKGPLIYKARKFACRALKGTGVNSGIRIVYAHYKEEDVIEFIEIYFKGDKEKEDRKRISKYFN